MEPDAISHKDIHLSDEELLCAADGELSAGRKVQIRGHLAACWSCRARLAGLERTIADFVQLQESADPLPPPARARALLKAHMAGLDKSSPASHWSRFWPLHRLQVQILACVVAAVVAPVAFLRMRTAMDHRQPPSGLVESRAIPDPRLTPGAILPVTREDVCTGGSVETVRLVPPAVAQAVFAEYGIREPRPKAYEVDYLITPALGGSDNVRNFWPQSYRETAWNAHIKDALEDHLHHLVCAGELELTTAQQDISRDWVAAYKKYFHTASPLPEHVDFLKDRPWE